MRRVPITVATTCCLVLLLGAPRAWTASNEGGISTDLKNEKLVRAMYEDLIEAWNRHDAPAVAKLWAIRAVAVCAAVGTGVMRAQRSGRASRFERAPQS